MVLNLDLPHPPTIQESIKTAKHNQLTHYLIDSIKLNHYLTDSLSNWLGENLKKKTDNLVNLVKKVGRW